MDNNDTVQQTIHELSEELRNHLNELMMGLVTEYVVAGAGQIPGIMARPDWTNDQKIDGARQIQNALVAPFVNGVVNSALATGMELGQVLFLVGRAWEDIRAEQLARQAEQMLNLGGQRA